MAGRACGVPPLSEREFEKKGRDTSFCAKSTGPDRRWKKPEGKVGTGRAKKEMLRASPKITMDSAGVGATVAKKELTENFEKGLKNGTKTGPYR